MTTVINTYLDDYGRGARIAADGLTASNFANGANNASCMPGIGIAMGAGTITASDSAWTLLDQNGLARTPQDSQAIGGIAYTDPAVWPSSGGVSGPPQTPIRGVTVDNAGTGAITNLGVATLASLATGWVVV